MRVLRMPVSHSLSLSVIFIETLAIDFGDDRESAGISISTRVIRRRVERMNVLNALVQITTRARVCVSNPFLTLRMTAFSLVFSSRFFFFSNPEQMHTDSWKCVR